MSVVHFGPVIRFLHYFMYLEIHFRHGILVPISEKKENDLNYVIVTPKRRKTKQLCHVNMLKSYYERKSGVQVVNTIEIGNNTDVADTTELFNLSESTKLHNSDVLRDIDHTKLSHLNEAQRRDIKVLAQEYQDP